MATEELERTLALVDNLESEDWSQPTACTLWEVRDMVSHMAGANAQHASWAEVRRQSLQNPYIREADLPIDGINRRQVEDRAEATPARAQ